MARSFIRPSAAALATLATLALACAPGSAQADEEAAETCVSAKVQDSYAEQWSVRTTTTTTLGQGQREIYVLTLHSGNAYRVMSCGDAHLIDLDVVIYDDAGQPVASEGNRNREPTVEFTPPATGRYFVGVFATTLTQQDAKAGVSTAVTYKQVNASK